MILRLGANAALHMAGGVAMGVTLALAACTVARTAARGSCVLRDRMNARSGDPSAGADPAAPPPGFDGP